MNFEPKKDLLYTIVIWSIPIFILPFLVFLYSKTMLIIFICAIGLSVWIWNSTNYKIEKGELFIKSWILRKYVKIENILKVRKTNNILSSYALSSERLEITEKSKNRFYIAPKDFNTFISELLKINPNIEIK
ncbi:MAG: PH domain-containing protein [Ignavibacteriae bacterium]|nr:PH domain-containing protein [Ignavibacteriota bacterium]